MLCRHSLKTPCPLPCDSNRATARELKSTYTSSHLVEGIPEARPLDAGGALGWDPRAHGHWVTGLWSVACALEPPGIQALPHLFSPLKDPPNAVVCGNRVPGFKPTPDLQESWGFYHPTPSAQYALARSHLAPLKMEVTMILRFVNNGSKAGRRCLVQSHAAGSSVRPQAAGGGRRHLKSADSGAPGRKGCPSWDLGAGLASLALLGALFLASLFSHSISNPGLPAHGKSHEPARSAGCSGFHLQSIS